MTQTQIGPEYQLTENVSEFGEQIKKLHGVDVNLCYQCRKCTSGCPLNEAMDLSPAQVIHAVRLGLKELVLNSNTYWLCLACGMCTARCPQEAGLLMVMDALANMSIAEKVTPKEPRIAEFYRIGMGMISSFGMIYDLGVAGILKFKSGQILRDLPLATRMITKGKLEILPQFHNSRAVKKLVQRVRTLDAGQIP